MTPRASAVLCAVAAAWLGAADARACPFPDEPSVVDNVDRRGYLPVRPRVFVHRGANDRYPTVYVAHEERRVTWTPLEPSTGLAYTDLDTTDGPIEIRPGADDERGRIYNIEIGFVPTTRSMRYRERGNRLAIDSDADVIRTEGGDDVWYDENWDEVSLHEDSITFVIGMYPDGREETLFVSIPWIHPLTSTDWLWLRRGAIGLLVLAGRLLLDRRSRAPSAV